MRISEVASVQLDPLVQKYLARAAKSIKSEVAQLRSSSNEASLKTEVEGTHKVRIILEFHRWINEMDLPAIEENFFDGIKWSDKEGHIFKIEEGESSSPQYAEALLSGLRPGMKVNAEALFPTLEYIVTWKQIMKKR